MADPLSITAGVAGLITLADVVIERLYRTSNNCKNAAKDIQRLLIEIQSLVGILKGLHGLEKQVSQTAFRSNIPDQQRRECTVMLENLRDKLAAADPASATSKLARIGKIVKWSITSFEMDNILKKIEGYKSTFNLAVSMDVVEAMMQTSSDQDNIIEDVKAIRRQLHRLEMTQEKREMLRFFGASDPEQNLDMSVELRHAGTGLWLTESPEMKTWITERNSKLWLFGIPGAGKTVLAGAIIEKAMNKASSKVGVAYYFCDHKNANSKEPQNILASMLGQLASQNEACFRVLRQLYQPADSDVPIRNLPRSAALKDAVTKIALHFDDVVLIVDGIDECNDPTEVAADLNILAEQPGSNIKIAALSRDQQEIRCQLTAFVPISIAANSNDLRLFVSARIEELSQARKLRITSPLLTEDILERLSNGAVGMFRWVVCQLAHLCDLPSDADRRDALNSLPPDLNTTYARILERINTKPPRTQRIVQRTLFWLIDNPRNVPRITAQQLCQAVAIEDEQKNFNPERVISLEDILYHCKSLVRLSHDGQYLELAHFTVEEYLRLPVTSIESQLAQYFYSDEAALYKARACLTFISMKHFQGTLSTSTAMRERTVTYPFYDFAASAWNVFVPFERFGLQEKILGLELFTAQSETNLKAWAQAYMLPYLSIAPFHGYEDETVRNYSQEAILFSESFASAKPLHFSCLLGMAELTTLLIRNGSAPNAEGLFGQPLHSAILGLEAVRMSHRPLSVGYRLRFHRFGASEPVMKILLEAGANPHAEFAGCSEKPTAFLLALIVGNIKPMVDYGVLPDRACLLYLLDNPDTLLNPSSLSYLFRHCDPQGFNAEDREAYLMLRVCEGQVTDHESSDLVAQFKKVPQSSLETALQRACQNDTVGMVEQICQSYDCNPLSISFRDTGKSLLRTAVESSAINNAAYLLQQGCDIHEKDAAGNTLLHIAVAAKSRQSNVASRSGILKLLLDNDIDVNALDADGNSLWHLAALHDRYDMFQLLLGPSKGQACDAIVASGQVNSAGMTPVHVAAQYSTTVFTSMCELDWPLGQIASGGITVLHSAAKGGSHGTANLERICKLGMDFTLTTEDQSTAAHYLLADLAMVENHDLEKPRIWRSLEILHKAGTDLTSTRADGATPLHVFCESLASLACRVLSSYHNLELCIDLLLKAGVNPLSKDEKQRTCLDILLEKIHSEKEMGRTGARIFWALVKIAQALEDTALLAYRFRHRSLLTIAAYHQINSLSWTLLARGANADDIADEIGYPLFWEGRIENLRLSPLELLVAKGSDSEVLQTAVQSSCSVNRQGSDGRGLLHWAADTGNLTAIEILDKAGADLEITEDHNWTPLDFAYKEEVLAFLIRRSSVIKPVRSFHTSMKVFHRIGPLEKAAFDGSLNKVKIALLHRYKYAFDADVSVLWAACCSQSHKLVRHLLDAGEFLGSCRVTDSASVLHAAAMGGSKEIVTMLLETGFDFRLYNTTGHLPSHYALLHNHRSILDVLRTWEHAAQEQMSNIDTDDLGKRNFNMMAAPIEHIIKDGTIDQLRQFYDRDIDTDIEMSCGTCTSLILATSLGKAEISRFLISKGASLERKGCEVHKAKDLTPCHLAARSATLTGVLEQILDRPDVPKDLLLGSLAATDTDSMLHAAAANGNLGAVKLLIKHGAMVDSVGLNCRTPLHLAADGDFPECVRALIEGKANPNARDSCLQTPAHLAACKGATKAAQELIKSGAVDSTLSDCIGQTALSTAARKKHVETMNILICPEVDLDCSLRDMPSARASLLQHESIHPAYALHTSRELTDHNALFGYHDLQIMRARWVLRQYERNRLFGDINTPQFSRKTEFIIGVRPIYDAVVRSNTKVLLLLLEHGALINLEAGPEGTPLMAACAYGRLETVKILVRLGAFEQYEKNGVIFSTATAARLHPDVLHWLLVERYTDQDKLGDGSQNLMHDGEDLGASECTGKHDKFKLLNLDLVYNEDWEAYLAKLQPASRTIFICRMEGQECIIEKTDRPESQAT